MSDHAKRLQQLEEKLDEIEKDSDGNREGWWNNFYACHRCGQEWVDTHDSQPDEECPKCGAGGCSPVQSDPVDGPEG